MGELPLISKLQEILSSSDELLVTFLLDSSGSVGAEYPVLKKLTLDLIQKLPGITIQVIQFSQTPVTECPFTRDSVMLVSAVNRMRHIAGSTNMKDAFALVRTSLFRSITESSVPVVIFITDGQYSGESPVPEIKKLIDLRPSPQILGIGVGRGTNVDDLRQILPNQPVFHTADYTSLNRFISQLTTIPANAEPAIRIKFNQLSKDLQKSREDLKLEFVCEPDMPLNTLCAGTKIRFLANKFFFGEEKELEKPATKGNAYVGQILLKIKPEALHYGEFPEKIWYEATIPGSPRGKYKGYVTMLLGWLAGDFVYKENPNRNINILLWGPMGCGKTSFINGLVSVFSGTQTVKTPLTAYRNDHHVTKEYSGNMLADNVNDGTSLVDALQNQLKLKVWDTWGLTQTTYRKLSILNFLEGRVPHGTQLNDSPATTRIDDGIAIDAVILLIPLGTSQDTQLLKTLGDTITTILDFGIFPVVVINFVNTVKSEEEILKAYNTIYTASHLNKPSVFMIDNYEHEEYRNMEKDLMYWRIMKKVFEEAKKAILRKNRERLAGNNNTTPTTPTSLITNYNAPPPLLGSPGPARPILVSKVKKCQHRTCSNRGHIVEDSFVICPFCGTTPVEEAPPPLVVSGKKLCLTASCSNKGKEVTYPNCPFCGQPPVEEPVATTPASSGEKICMTMNCQHQGKPVSYPNCGYCGKPPAYPVTKVCVTPTCVNFRVPLTFPRCPYCGNAADVFVEKKIRQCINSACSNYRGEVNADFKYCPFCGSQPAEL